MAILLSRSRSSLLRGRRDIGRGTFAQDEVVELDDNVLDLLVREARLKKHFFAQFFADEVLDHSSDHLIHQQCSRKLIHALGAGDSEMANVDAHGMEKFDRLRLAPECSRI